MIKKEQIIEILQTCFDPEIPIDLWNLGLIYDINIKKDTINSFCLTLTLFQLDKIHTGIKKVVKRIINKEIPSIPI